MEEKFQKIKEKVNIDEYIKENLARIKKYFSLHQDHQRLAG